MDDIVKNNKNAAHAFVYGRVQGIGFRYWVLQIAQSFNVTGWVRNCPDYSVEIFAEAEPHVLHVFFDTVSSKHPRAYISDCTITKAAYEGHRSFEIRY